MGGVPSIVTTWRRCGSSSRRAATFSHCPSFSTRMIGASEWLRMYLTSSGDEVV